MNNISKKWMKWIPLFTLAALCIGFAGGRAATKAETAENHKIADGVYIGNVYVGAGGSLPGRFLELYFRHL